MIPDCVVDGWRSKWWEPEVDEGHWCRGVFDSVTEFIYSPASSDIDVKVGVNLFTLCIILQSLAPLFNLRLPPKFFISGTGQVGVRFFLRNGFEYEVYCGKSVSRFGLVYRSNLYAKKNTMEIMDEEELEKVLKKLRTELEDERTA